MAWFGPRPNKVLGTSPTLPNTNTPALVTTRLLAQVVSMGQVLTLLGLSVADPLRSAVAVLSIDVPALFIHFECHGIEHSYYAGWLVTAHSPQSQFGAARAHRRWLSTKS